MTKDQLLIKVNYMIFNKLVMIFTGFVIGCILGSITTYYLTDQESDDYIKGYTDAMVYIYQNESKEQAD
jgi:ABC-type phosphate transport system permease subunit|tara:strand:+ start:156 stop:362 length:207 start_codon:yes stop_codon:yes gene_type:complete